MTKNTQNSEFDAMMDLDSLFAAARETQPGLHDDNFTKVVVNSLPDNNIYASRAIEQKRVNKRGVSMDLMGGLFGLMLLFLFVDVGSLAHSVLKLVPESVTLSPLLLVAAFGALMFTTVGAWWTMENNKI